jgi:hypothetical protein
MQNGLLAINNQSMASIVTALKAYDGTYVTCQQVDNLTLALITPLDTQDDNILSHKVVSPDYKSLRPSKIHSLNRIINGPHKAAAGRQPYRPHPQRVTANLVCC